MDRNGAGRHDCSANSVARSSAHAWVKFESDCCSFLDFEIALVRGAERVSLSVAGETAAKALLRELLRQAEFELEEALQRGS